MVSNMSWTSVRNSASKAATGSARVRSAGCPSFTISRTMVERSAGVRLDRGHPADAPPLDHQLGGLGGADGDPVFVGVHHRADDPARGHDLVALLERGDHRLMALL